MYGFFGFYDPRLCSVKGCKKAPLEGKMRCLDCEVEGLLPSIEEELDELCAVAPEDWEEA